MRSINITATGINEVFSELKKHFGGEVSYQLKEHILKIDSELGYGEIRGMELKGKINFFQINMLFNEDVKLVFNTPTKSLVNFAYCADGKVAHSFGTREERVELETFQTGILSNITNTQNILYFEREMQISTCLISVNTIYDDYKTLTINDRLKAQFIDNRTNDLAFVGTYNLKIAEQIKKLEAIKQEGVVRTLLIEGLVHVILALELEQHKKDVKRKEVYTGSLTTKEMARIKELSEFIQNYPETPLTVTEMAHKINLTPSKLQEGFKLMHGRTVNDFVRDVRVTKSEELIKTTDLNISQILYTLGFSSRSYFSKIFKEKYNCSPSQYKAQIKLAVTA